MKNAISFILILLISNICFGQAKLFEPNIISDNNVFGGAISPDGKMLLFVKAYGGRDTLQIFQSYKRKRKWQSPQLAFFADTNYKEIDPVFSPDGKTILYNKLVSAENSFDIFAVHKTPNGWTKPEKLSDAINTTSSDFYATISHNKNIYFTRRIKSNDIYVSYFKNNNYQKAIPLEATINSDNNESNPYISPNEDYLIYFSDRTGGFGETDLYISFNKNYKWSYPINLGKKVNSPIAEFCPAVDFKNNLFTFSRTEVEKGKRIENIYSIPIKSLQFSKLKRSAKWID